MSELGRLSPPRTLNWEILSFRSCVCTSQAALVNEPMFLFYCPPCCPLCCHYLFPFPSFFALLRHPSLLFFGVAFCVCISNSHVPPPVRSVVRLVFFHFWRLPLVRPSVLPAPAPLGVRPSLRSFVLPTCLPSVFATPFTRR